MLKMIYVIPAATVDRSTNTATKNSDSPRSGGDAGEYLNYPRVSEEGSQYGG